MQHPLAAAATEGPPTMRRRLRLLLSHPVTDHLVGGLIILSVLTLFLEILVDNPAPYRRIGDIISLIFVVELSLRFVAAISKGTYLRRYFFDIMSLLPLLLPDYGFLRVLRLLRLFRLGPLMRQSNRSLGGLFRRTLGEQLTIISILLVVVMGASLGIVGTEESFNELDEAVWWSILSVMAGEPIGATPETDIGRWFTLVIMLGAMTIFALLTGTITAVITERLRIGASMNQPDIEELEGHVIVCGWNRSTGKLLEELTHATRFHHVPILLIAQSKPNIPFLDDHPRICYMEGDYTTLEVLKKARVSAASTAILLADKSVPERSDQDRDARTILAGLMIEKLRPGIFTCAELLSRENEQHLRLAGIEEVVVGDEYSATILATSSRIRGVVEIADEVFSTKYGNQIYKLPIHGDWEGKTFLELQGIVKTDHDALLIAVERHDPTNNKRSGEEVSPYRRTMTNPPADMKLERGDHLLVLAKDEPEW